MRCREPRDHLAGEALRRVDARCRPRCRRAGARTAAAASRAGARCRLRPATRSRRTPDPSVTGVASMRCVRPAFTTCANSRCFLRNAFASFSAAGISSSATASAAARCTADGNTSFDDCDAFTWSFGMHRAVAPSARRRQARDHLVRVHVRRRARPGLERVDRELVVVRAVGDLVGRGRDRVRDPPIDLRHVGERRVDPAPPRP